MAFFEQGIKILTFLASIFFLIFFFLTYNWTAPHGFGEKRNARAAFMVTSIYTFQLFLIGTMIVGILAFILKYFSDIIKLIVPV